MAHLIWTEPALLDLEEVADYIALDNPAAASKLVRTVFSRIERLEEHPLSGRKPPELDKTPYREVIVPPCRIFYRTDNNHVYILSVMRGERQLMKYMLDGRKLRPES